MKRLFDLLERFVFSFEQFTNSQQQMAAVLWERQNIDRERFENDKPSWALANQVSHLI